MTKNSSKNLKTPSNKLNIGLKMDILQIFSIYMPTLFGLFLDTTEHTEYKKAAELTFFTS